jgi:peptidoglycan hydrolase-like protein with peptidoglycan-binding domain
MFLDFASKPIGRISRKREPAELQFANPQLNVTGDYDQATKAAVTAFQQSHNCDVDGWLGPQTTDAIKAAFTST